MASRLHSTSGARRFSLASLLPAATRRIVALLLAVTGAILTAEAAAQDSAEAILESEIATAPVQFEGETLFRVRGASSLPAQTRARRIGEEIRAAAADPTVSLDSLSVVRREGVVRIVAGDRPLATFVEADARLEQIGLDELAGVHFARVREAIAAYRDARSPASIRRALTNSTLATAAFVAGIVMLLWVWQRLDQIVRRRLRLHVHTIAIQSLPLVRAETIAAAIENAFGAIRTLLLLGVALVYAGFVLAELPWTRGLSRNVASLIVGPLQVMGRGIVSSIPGLAFVLVLVFVLRLVLKLLRAFFDAVGHGSLHLAGFDPDWAQPTYKIIRTVLIAFGLVIAYPYVPGSGSDAFKGISLFAGVVLSLGSSSAISNIIAGYMMTYRRAFKVGDRIRVGDAVGDVIEMRLQVTHLRSLKNEELIIPNSQILTSEVLNYSSLARAHGPGLILHTEVGIGYETPWRQVESLLLMAAMRTPGLASDPPPFVLVTKLGDIAVTYEVNAFCNDVRAMIQLYSELHRRILDVFNEYGVQIMTPAYEGDPETPKIVRREDWYATPASLREELNHRVAPG